MILTLKVLNSDATLNSFEDIGNYEFVKGSTAILKLQLFQPDKHIRYIPVSGATITMDFQKSDNTVLTKTATYPFADDRSIIQISLTAVETALIISQNLVAKLDETGTITYAILQGGLQLVSLTQNC
jgi:hypothetical protein